MSFNIAMTGLNAASEQLATTSNNIANANTTGFKSSRTEFGSVYADTQAMGVEVLGTTQSISLGGTLINTSRTLDLALSGTGFFMVQDTTGETQYTRAGVFGLDTNGNVVNKSGQKLLGHPTNADGELMLDTVGDLRIRTANLPAKATESIEFVANLDANTTPLDPVNFNQTNVNTYHSTYTTKVYDTLGKEHTLTQYFVNDVNTPGSWEVFYYLGTNPVGTHTLSFGTNGLLDSADAISNLVVAVPGADSLDIDLDYTGTTQYGTNFGVYTNLADGYTSGEQTGLGIDSKGNVFANYSNGQSQLQGQIVLARFINPEGLKSVSGTSWVATNESGEPLTGSPGVAQFGTVNSGALENSNVDLTEELVNLMQGQRSYQANTKVISTQKDLDQILFSAM